MKKVIFLCLLLFVVGSIVCSYNGWSAVSWTKSWSSDDDGSSFSGDDIKNIQDDIEEQFAIIAGDNIFTGTNIWSGTNTFTGPITGVSSAAHSITRGFELEWGSVEQVIVRVGTLYHGTTQVNKTANVHLDVTTATDYITGVSQQATDDWLYVYVNSSGGVDFDNTAPDKSDTSGDTEGTLIYYYYAGGSTYHRCIGAVRLNATGSGEIVPFYQRKDIVMYDVPQNLTTTLSSNAWTDASSKAAGDAATLIPTISTMGIFGLYVADTINPIAALYIRPHEDGGTHWSTNTSNGIYSRDASGSTYIGGQRWCATDSSQKINYFNYVDNTNIRIDVEGYILDIR